MERSLGWQRAMMDLAGDDEGWRAQLTEVCGWFPSTEMLVNHARGLVKVLTDARGSAPSPTAAASRRLSYSCWQCERPR